MLDSVKISRRQSEIRQQLSELVAKTEPTEDETRSMEMLDKEYHSNETRYRAALITEDEERKVANDDFETREGTEWSDLVSNFEVRQIASYYAENRELSGVTAEVIQEMRSHGSYQGLPIPLEALEQRAGETIASGTPDPISTRPIIDRIFAESVGGRMGAQFINIPMGEVEWPVVTSSVSAGWAASETGDVASPVAFATTDKALTPEQNFGVQMKITRKSLKQSGAALEQAVRRDMNNAIQVGLDQAIFLGSGSSGEPLGVIAGAGTYGINETAIDAAVSWSAFRGAITTFLTANAISSPSEVRVMIRPEVWSDLDDTLITSTAVSEYDRLTRHVGDKNVVITSNALAAQAGSPLESKALLTTRTGGVSPIFVGLWGGVDVIRDPYTDAASGGLRLTGLLTTDVTVARPAQLEVLTDLQ